MGQISDHVCFLFFEKETESRKVRENLEAQIEDLNRHIEKLQNDLKVEKDKNIQLAQQQNNHTLESQQKIKSNHEQEIKDIQDFYTKQLTDNGVGIFLGNFKKISKDLFIKTIFKLLNDERRMQGIRNKMENLFDVNSIKIIVNEMLRED